MRLWLRLLSSTRSHKTLKVQKQLTTADSQLFQNAKIEFLHISGIIVAHSVSVISTRIQFSFKEILAFLANLDLRSLVNAEINSKTENEIFNNY